MTSRQPRAVPREGLTAPVFDGMGAGDDLIVSLSFSPGLTDRQLHVVYRWLRALAQSADRGDPGKSPFETAEPFVHEHLFHARLGNLHDSRAAVLALIADLTAASARIKDSFFARWRWRPDGVMGPSRDPRAPAEHPDVATVREYLDRLWDPDAVPPASELEVDLRGGFLDRNELVLEHRGTPLFFPDLRIGYGVAPYGLAPADRRTEEVRRVVVEALDAGWRTLFKAPGMAHTRPQPLSHDGGVDQVDRIVCGTRSGYLFSIEAVQLLDRPAPSSCRYREYELMEAVLDAVGRLGLAPVVTWQRYGTPLMGRIRRPDTVEVQLWEPGGGHADHPGLDVPFRVGQAGDGPPVE